MTKPQRTFVLLGILALLIAGVLIAVLRLRSRPSPNSDIGVAWVTVKTNAAKRDTGILDAVIGDALTNKELASTMEFYGGASNRTVRYTGFPAGYKPTVPGYEFVALPREPATGRKLTISLGGLWIDRAPPKDKFTFILPKAPKGGALLGIYNSGGGTIGGCAVGYEIQEIAGVWRVRCAGYFDP
jgi:hypothetical protein